MSKSDRDEQIGRSLVGIRGTMSQADLALRMRERGYKWSASTVWAIEKGDRPLKLTEAVDVLEILGIDLHPGLDELLNASGPRTEIIRDRIRQMDASRRTVSEALPALADDAVHLATYAAGLREQLEEPGSRYLLEATCDALEFAGVGNLGAIADHLRTAVDHAGGPEWVEHSRPFSTFLFGSENEINEARESLGLEPHGEE